MGVVRRVGGESQEMAYRQGGTHSQRDSLRQPLLQQTVSGVSSYDTDAALIEERNRDMREIEGELSALRDVMRDVKGLVDEGRDQLDIVEEQVVVSDIRVEKGIDDLTDANRLACSARWKKLMPAHRRRVQCTFRRVVCSYAMRINTTHLVL